MNKEIVQKIRFWLLVVFVVCIGAATVVVVLLPPFIKNTIETAVEESVDCRCRVGRVRVMLPNRIGCDRFRIDSLIVSGCSVSVSLPRVGVRIRPLALFSGGFSIPMPSLPIDSATADTVDTTDTGRMFWTMYARRIYPYYERLRTSPFTRIVPRVSLHNGRVDVQCSTAKGNLGVEELDATLAFEKNDATRLSFRCGTLSADTMMFARNVGIDAHLHDSTLYVDRIDASLWVATMHAKAAIHIPSGSISNALLEVTGIDLNKMSEHLSDSGLKGTITGTAALSFIPAGTLYNVESITGSGSFEITDCTLRDNPLQENILVAIFMKEIQVLRFSRITSDITVKDSRVYNTNTHGRGDPLEFYSRGWVGTDMRMHQKMQGAVSKDFAKGLPHMVRTALDKKDDGTRQFECTISGTLQKPSVKFDRRHYSRAIGSAMQGITKGLKDLFGK